MAAHFHKDYFFQVLSNAIIVDGTKVVVNSIIPVVLVYAWIAGCCHGGYGLGFRTNCQGVLL